MVHQHEALVVDQFRVDVVAITLAVFAVVIDGVVMPADDQHRSRVLAGVRRRRGLTARVSRMSVTFYDSYTRDG